MTLRVTIPVPYGAAQGERGTINRGFLFSSVAPVICDADPYFLVSADLGVYIRRVFGAWDIGKQGRLRVSGNGKNRQRSVRRAPGCGRDKRLAYRCGCEVETGRIGGLVISRRGFFSKKWNQVVVRS